MADFFSALGKSRALETIAGVQERAFQTNLAEIQSGSELLKTGLEIEKFKQTREINELGIAEAKAEAAQREKDEAFNARVISVDAITSQFEGPLPGSSDLIKQSLIDFGLAREGPGGVMTTTIGELKRGQELLEGNVDLQKKLVANSVTKLQGFVTATQAEISEEIEKNGPQSPKLEKLREKLGAFIETQSGIVEFAAKEDIRADIKEEADKPGLEAKAKESELKRQRDFAKDAATSNERFLLFTDQFAKLDAATTQRGIVVLDALTKAAAQTAPGDINGVDAAREAQRSFREIPIKIQEQLDAKIDPDLIRERLVELFGKDGALMWEPMFVSPDKRPNWFVNLMRSAGDFLTGAE